MRQYRELKAQTGDCLLFFRLGDFYEMFGEDARVAAGELDLTLTTRDRGAEREEDRVPMCGVPYHSAESYIARLVERGYKVALCEQTEDPKAAKGLVRREVVRIVTPGTVTEASMLDESRNNYICAVFWDDGGVGLCFADITTGEAYATQVSGEDLLQPALCELGRFAPREAVLDGGAARNDALVGFLRDRLGCAVERPAQETFDEAGALTAALAQFQAGSAAALGLEDRPRAVCAVGGLLHYLRETQKGGAACFGSLNVYAQGRFMELDLTARRNLELTAALQDGGKKGSLLWVLDHTKTPMGGRLLRGWIEKPLLSPVDITRRLRAVDELTRGVELRGELRAALSGVADMERLVGRLVFGSGGGRDARALAGALERLPAVKELLGGGRSALLRDLFETLDPLADLCATLDKAFADAPPHSVREGGFIRDGYDAEVDRLRGILRDTRGLVARMEAQERERTGIKSLKIGYNKVFGYYIEVTRSHYHLVPEDYIRKQTLAGCERFITDGLKEMESTILTAQERLTALEYELFLALRETLAQNAPRVQRTAQVVAGADVLCSLAEAAALYRYVMPEVDHSDVIRIREGRHPVVERMLAGGLFVPNDAELDGKSPVSIITGPNMAGKSTYMRQVALIVLMAQIGSFVPAASARVGVADRIFTRIGASDDLAGGRSTFMVEMTEVADILRHATAGSLLILDEIGRGTSTFDGMSVARAVLEYAASNRLGARTLFATHYHELTELENTIPGVRNYNVAVKKRGGEIIFLRKIVPGGADDSYGVEVAALAGIPEAVIARAREVLRDLEAGAPVREARGRRRHAAGDEGQLSLTDLGVQEITERLRRLDTNTLTPLEALTLLHELCRKARAADGG
jgi:DNA mismatch repair protein MutS